MITNLKYNKLNSILNNNSEIHYIIDSSDILFRRIILINLNFNR